MWPSPLPLTVRRARHSRSYPSSIPEPSKAVLPDYPKAKNFLRTALLRRLRAEAKVHEPLLGGVGSTTVHEGRTTQLTRADSSTSQVTFVKINMGVELTREEMKNSSLEQLVQHVSTMAKQLAESQARILLENVARGADEVGNTVSVSELGAKEAFLEAQRRRHVEFDPKSMVPLDEVIIASPGFLEQMKEWEKDPNFLEEFRRIREQQIEKWRERENRRRLAD
jgi:hypothetical protein